MTFLTVLRESCPKNGHFNPNALTYTLPPPMVCARGRSAEGPCEVTVW
jgi:hypothetical protein